MKIMTWNINQLLGNNNWEKLTQKEKEIFRNKYKEEVQKYIKDNYFEKDYDIIALQEFPYGSQKDYEDFIKDFKDERYEAFPPPNVSGIFTTIAFAKKDVWKRADKKFFFVNRVVIVEKAGCSIVCVHIPDLKRRPEAESLWKEIGAMSTHNINIIMGDFNTDYESTEQFKYFSKLEFEELEGNASRKGEGMPPTCNEKTHVDYILINKQERKNVYNYEIDTKVEALRLSDHFPLYAEIDICI